MPNLPDASTPIRSFLIRHPGQHCQACLVEGTALDVQTVKAAFKPSKYNPYSFMWTCCSRCKTTAMCVAYVGEPNALSRQNSAIAVSSGNR